MEERRPHAAEDGGVDALDVFVGASRGRASDHAWRRWRLPGGALLASPALWLVPVGWLLGPSALGLATPAIIAQTNPQRLYVIDRDSAIGADAGQSAKQVLDNDLVKGTDAAQNDQITYLDGTSWYVIGAGLSNVASMVDEISSSLG